MADIKKFLDQGGVSTLWSRIADKIAAEQARAEAAEAANATAAKNAQDDVDALTTYVGTFTHDTAKSVVEYINAKTSGIATSGNLEALSQRVDTIAGDYLKTADKTELSTAITEEANRAKGVESGLETRLKAVEDDYLKAADKTELQGNIDTVSGKVTTLIGDDANKSVRTIANEELAKQLIAEGAAESLDTLAEIAAWIQSHPNDASAMNAAITALQKQMTGIAAGEGTVKKYVDDAITALKIGDYAKAVDLTDAVARIKVIEDDYLTAEDKTELSDAIALKADQTSLNAVSAVANAAATQTFVKTELAKKATQVDLEAEAALARAAEKANADAITLRATKEYVDAELAKKQNTIPANTYDTYGAAAQALADAKTHSDTNLNTAKSYTDTEVAKIQALTTAEIDAAIANATAQP